MTGRALHFYIFSSFHWVRIVKASSFHVTSKLSETVTCGRRRVQLDQPISSSRREKDSTKNFSTRFCHKTYESWMSLNGVECLVAHRTHRTHRTYQSWMSLNDVECLVAGPRIIAMRRHPFPGEVLALASPIVSRPPARHSQWLLSMHKQNS